MRYQRVATEAELLEVLSQSGATILCGGTDLLIKMRAEMIQPELLIDISRVKSLRGIRVEGSNLEIGAATLESDIIHSPLVTEHVPLLGSVLRQLGSVQIRNRGTLGGNIVNASPAADGVIPLLLYATEIQIVSADGERWVRLEDIFTGPSQTTLEPGEYVRTLRLPVPTAPFEPFYHKVGKRNALTIAIASLGMLVHLEEGVIRQLRVAVGSVAPTPRRLRGLEEHLAGRSLDEHTIHEARELAVASISPISDVRATADYRRNVIGDLLVRALRSHAL
ncbi:FAD binding domain-containing protein [Candidatus Bipolaricaulota bacterium]